MSLLRVNWMLKICKWILEQLLHRAIEYQRVKASIVRCHSNMFTYLCSQPMFQHQKVFQHIKSFLKANNILKASRFLLLVYSHIVNSHLVNFPLCQHWPNGNWQVGIDEVGRYLIAHSLQLFAVTQGLKYLFFSTAQYSDSGCTAALPKVPMGKVRNTNFCAHGPACHGNTFITFQRFQV